MHTRGGRHQSKPRKLVAEEGLDKSMQSFSMRFALRVAEVELDTSTCSTRSALDFSFSTLRLATIQAKFRFCVLLKAIMMLNNPPGDK